MPYRINDSGDIQYLNSPKEFFVTDGTNYKLKGKGCYFLRNNNGKPIKKETQNDSTVLFGEVSEHSVYSLNTIINQIFKPLVD